jgi:hypothetical protein
MKIKCIVCGKKYNTIELQFHYIVDHMIHIIPTYHETLHCIHNLDLFTKPKYYYMDGNNRYPYNNMNNCTINMALFNKKTNIVLRELDGTGSNLTYHYIDLVKMTIYTEPSIKFLCIPMPNYYCLEHEIEVHNNNNDYYPLRSIYFRSISQDIIMNKEKNNSDKTA